MTQKTIALVVGLALGFPLGAAHADDWKNSRLGKQALEKRPKNHPKGKPWVSLWSDSTPSNEAKPLKVKLVKKNENKTCNALDDDKDGQIDEKCGMKSGPFQVTMVWDHKHSMDIQVMYSPWDATRHEYDSGAVRVTHGYGDDEDHSKGYIGSGRKKRVLQVSKDAKGTCSCEAKYVNGELTKKRKGCKVEQGDLWAEADQYVENVWLDGDEALPGIYSISFYNHSTCVPFGGKDQVRVTVGVSVNGETIGHFKSGDLGVQGFSFPILTVYVPPTD